MILAWLCNRSVGPGQAGEVFQQESHEVKGKCKVLQLCNSIYQYRQGTDRLEGSSVEKNLTTGRQVECGTAVCPYVKDHEQHLGLR